MPKPHIVIVGGGLTGLSTGCYARFNGFGVTVLEHAHGSSREAAYRWRFSRADRQFSSSAPRSRSRSWPASRRVSTA